MKIARVDRNQSEIVKALRSMGLSVHITSSIGGGFPDLVSGYGGFTYLNEIKDGLKPPSGRALTEMEQKFFDAWKGHVCVLKSIEDAVQFANNVRNMRC